MNKKIVIIGNGGHAKVVADIIELCQDSIVGFIVDKKCDAVNQKGLKWLGDFSIIEKYKNECEFIIAIGSNEVRRKIASQFNLKWYTAIHPSAIIDKTASIAQGSSVMANAVINGYAQIGSHCIINTAAIVEHDCSIGDFSHLSPNSTICGMSTCGEEVHLGASSTVINKINITSQVVVGASSCVIKSILESGTYVGVPVRKVNKC